MSISDNDVIVQQPFTGAISRTQHDKNAESISVQDFGAVGDGVADDAISIQKALDYARNFPNGCCVEFGPHIYSLSKQIRVYSNTELDLKGGTLRRDYNTSPTGASVVGCFESNDNTSKNIYIHDGNIDVNCDSYSTSANGFTTVRINNLKIERIKFLDVNDFHAIDMTGADGVFIDNCHFLGFKNASGNRAFSEAIQIDSGVLATEIGLESKNIIVSNNYFGANPASEYGAWGGGFGNHGSSSTAPYMTNIIVTGNIFDGLTNVAVRILKARNLTISSNTFNQTANSNSILLLMYSNLEDSTTSACHNVIITQNIIKNTSSSHAIFISDPPSTITTPSKHTNINISNNIIIGNSMANGISVRWVSGGIIKANTIDSGSTAIAAYFIDNVAIDSNVGKNFSNTFIYVAESSVPEFSEQGITNSVNISNNVGSDIGLRGVHINCAAKGITISNNTFKNVSTVANTRTGISADTGADGIIITGNHVIDGDASIKPAYGVYISASCKNAFVSGNRLYGQTAPVFNAATGVSHVNHYGIGTPQGVITAPSGSIWSNTNGGSGTSLYVKESGIGNTGWVAK